MNIQSLNFSIIKNKILENKKHIIKYVIVKIRIKLVSELVILKFKLYSLFKKNYALNKNLRDKKLLISLTTYPARFNFVYLTLESLMNQSVKPDKIILWLSQEEVINNKIPKKILSLKNRGLEIEVVNENLKSYKKLIYAIEKFPDLNIITCDDDALYPKYFIKKLQDKHIKHPDCVVAYRCSFMKKSSHKDLLPYAKWSKAETDKPSFNLFPTGVGGIFYPSNSLDKRVIDKELFLKLSPLGDDIWFKAMALLNKTKTVMVNKCSKDFFVITGSQKQALWRKNINENENDKQLKNVFDYFDLYQYLE